MASANASSDAATPPTALRWYSKVFSRRLDLIGDYVGNNFFLIDGNSLLLHCLSDEHIDFSQGFQLLHAAWAVERFLKDLIRRRCHFHIAFFTQYRELCVPSFVSDETQREKFLLARAAIIRHLRANLPQAQPEVSVKVFESVFAEEFTNYLRDVEFFFVLAHDGAFPEALRTRYLLRNNFDASQDQVDDEENHRELQTKTAFRQIIHWFMSGGMSVALINGISFQDTKVMSNVLEHRNVESGVPLTIDFQNDTIDEPRPNYLKRSFWEKMNGDGNAKLSERQYISLLVLSALLHGEVISGEFANAFLRHSALISQLHLSERFVEAEGLDEETGDMLQEFCEEASLVLSSEEWANNMSEWKCICDVSDLVDGRLFAMCMRNKRVGRNESYDALVKAMAATGSEVAGNAETSEDSEDSNLRITPSQTSGTSYAVLPFSNNVIDPHLEPIKLSIDRSGEIPPAITSQIFREATHWHNSKRPMDPKIREDQIASSAKQMKKVLRRNQFFMAEMTTYAASLTNSVGRALEPEIITTGAKPEKKESENTKGKPAPKANQNPKGGKKGAPSRKEAMLAQIAKDKSRKDEASADTVVASWRVACDNLEKEPTAMARFQKAKQYLVALPESKKNVLEAEIRLYLLHNRLTVWVQFCKNNKKEENQHIAAGVYESLLSLSQLRRPVTKTIILCLEKTIKELSLPKVPLPTPTETDRKLAFKFVLSNNSGVSVTIPTDPITFQLSYCGPYLDRSMDSAPDPRVPFEPDAWQRKVLDEIDARRSLLVVAPTSAGKTFISFYAMQQVLASNDDDVLVYVAPTKALVNQIAAEVQGRFSKTYKYGGNSVWGIHTRDYRINNPTGCQILVTVPHILQIMLLAPSNAGSWAKRVKWIIFDEVHCIGQAEDGQVWEQLLLMAPCPIIALSATIGNPEEFSDWLNSTQKAVGNTLTMVRHPHRYSDLRKFKYTSVGSTEFQGLPESRAFARLGLDDEAFSFLHPVTSLINRSRGIPDDFSLEAADCLTLWQTLSKYQSANYPVEKSLDPNVALPPIVKKLDVIEWEKSLKEVLKLWMSDPDSPFEDVVKELGKSVSKSHFSLDNSKALAQKKDVDVGEDEDDEKEPEDTFDAESILPMLVRLHEQDALPGIIFNYDRGLCEKICSTLLDQLETAETKWKETSPKWKSDLKKWEEYKAVMAKANKRNPPKLSKKKGNDEDGLTKEDIARDGANNEANPWASFDPERPVDRFHFADNKKLTREELDVYERELIRRDVPEWLLRGLRRGIGVHHAGMNRKYRQVCEMLFRRGYLRVVVATGTLALGINMPCKTVVFSGDSVFLTALNYRQAAGRAGRRGFDMLGNVVFHGVSESKIHRLISSRLPDINGHFPITTTLVLRLFTLLNESNQAPVAIRAVNALLSQPRLYLGGEESKLTVLHFLRFSIEYLRKQYLLGPKGEPVNLAGVVSHLYYAESSSFAFHALVKEGFFHRLCNNFDTQREAVLQEMILVMAHLFGRQSCKYADREFIENVVKRSPSIVFLPPMPEDASEILQKHNQSTLGVYKGYVKTFAEQHLDEPEDVLPLTNMGIKGDSSMKSSNLCRRAPPIVRSPFVALSGYTDDDIDSIHELCTTVRSGIFLEEAIVPYVGVYNEKSDMPLNAYLYDFYNHGDVKALAVANRIRRGDVWFVLNDFSMVLATIVTSLSNFMNLSAESELDVRGEGEGVEEAQEDKLLPDDSGYETGSTISAASRGPAARNVLPVQVKKKKKVADSWDDDADEEDLQAEAAAKAEKVEAELRALEEKPAWEEGQGLLNVLKAFKALKEEFDTKFRAMWA